MYVEGVCYAKKDYNLAKHPEIDVPNLQVIKLMQSFKSKEYVRETFAWMHYYWYLTNEGIEFLRGYLNLPSEIVPATLKKQAKPAGGRPFGGPGGDRPRYNLSFFCCLINYFTLLFSIFLSLCQVIFFLSSDYVAHSYCLNITTPELGWVGNASLLRFGVLCLLHWQ